MPSNICVVKGLKLYSNWSIWDCHSPVRKVAVFISALLADSQRITVKADKLREPARLRTEPDTHSCIRFIREISKITLSF